MLIRSLKKSFLQAARALGFESFVRSSYSKIQNVFFGPSKLQLLEEKVRFLYYEVSDLRTIQRHLIGERTNLLPEVEHTYESFDYQWKNLTDGAGLLTDEVFKKSVKQTIVQYTGLEESWFKGKRVLDAGCGNGRFSYGLALLGASVTSVDQSFHGVESARAAIEADPSLKGKVQFKQHNLLMPLEMDQQFDLVWSFGVLHHTGNTYVAFKNVIKTLKPGGRFFMMIYGEPEWNEMAHFYELNNYWDWRRKLRHLSPPDRVKLLEKEYGEKSEIVHGMFDAVSPLINDLYTESELTTWLNLHGFTDIERTVRNRNIFLTARYNPSKKSQMSAETSLQ